MDKHSANDLPIVLKGKTASRSALAVMTLMVATAAVIFALAAWAAFPHWLGIALILISTGLFWFAGLTARATIRPRPDKTVTIHKEGISIEHGDGNTGEYAWRDIIGIGHNMIRLIAGDQIGLYLSPEVALRRIEAKSYTGNPNTVYLWDLQGFSDWDLRPLARLIDRYRQICTGLPPLYNR